MKIFKVLLFLSLFFTTLTAQTLNVDGHVKSINLIEYIDIAVDSNASMTFDTIDDAKFIPNEASFLYYHFTHDVLWFRTVIDNTRSKTLEYMVFVPTAWLDNVTQYHIDNSAQVHKQQSGDRITYASRSIKHKDILFSLQLSPGVHTLYWRIQSNDALQVPMRLYESQAFLNKNSNEMLLFGIVLGIFFLMIVYNLFYFVYTKERLYEVYLFYILFFTLMTLATNGFLLHYVWPDWFWVNEIHYNVFLMAYLGFMLWFANEFLKTASYSTVWSRVLTWGARIYLSLALLSYVMPYTFMMELGVYSAALIPFIILIPAFIALRIHNIWARFYLAGALPNLFMYSVWAFGFFGFLGDSLLVKHANTVGVLIELMVFSFAMVYRIDSIVRTKNKLEQEIQIDSLTQIKNRYAFSKYFPEYVAHRLQEHLSVAFAIIDVDNFKLFNDTYGHQEGDEALIRVAAALKKRLNRSCDKVYRLGGEEFGMVVCPDSLERLKAQLERVRQTVIDESVGFEASPQGVVTVSIGLVVVDKNFDVSGRTIYQEADNALYEAKEKGRNQVVARRL